jgi:orotate phosphoribosyltransferase
VPSPAGPSDERPGALTFPGHARAVASALVASKAFTADLRMPRDQWYRWKSGILAPCGCNCRRLNAFPALRRLVDDALTDATRSSFPDADYIVAVAHAAIPWAKTVADRLDLPLAYVRAGPREAGGALVECSPGPGGRAVIIEDVVASGASAARAIHALRAETSLRVAGIASIANWNFPEMRALLAEWTVRAVTSYPQLLASAREAGLISDGDAGQLMKFYADPRGYRWHYGDGPSRHNQDRRARHLRVTRVSRSGDRAGLSQHLLQAAGQELFAQKSLTPGKLYFTLLPPN